MLDLNMGIKQVSIRVDKYLQQLLASTDDNDYVDPMIYYVCYLMWRKCGGNRKSERVRAIAQPSLSYRYGVSQHLLKIGWMPTMT